VEQPTVALTYRITLDRREVRAGVGFAHADAEVTLTQAYARQIAPLLLLGPEAVDQGPALAVGNPMSRDWRAGSQQLLDHHITRKWTCRRATVGFRQCHADPATGAQLPAELGIEPHPGMGSQG